MRKNQCAPLFKIALLAGAAVATTALASSALETSQVASSQGVERCSSLLGRTFSGAVVEKADFVAAGQPLNSYVNSSAGVCRVRARLSPTTDSLIKIEVWLPSSWNGKLLGSGGSGFNGGLSFAKAFLPTAVKDGYVGLVTDAGHDFSLSAKWALGHPEKLVDFGWRANHQGVLAAKALTASYYGEAAKRAYFQGCSNGGRDALMLAQRHPEDYDAIIAGAPAYNWTALFAGFLQKSQISNVGPGARTLTPKLDLVRKAALDRCDKDDGVKDGLIGNPAQCRFDPKVLQCKSGDGPDCLTKPELRALRTIYRGAKGPNGQIVMAGPAVGSEYEWAAWFGSPTSAGAGAAADYYRNMVYGDPTWDPTKFNFDRDYPAATERVGATLNATTPDLKAFLSRGGRLLMYQGWDDAATAPGNTIAYFKAMRRASGAASTNQTRLFMAPGMAHCSGGKGPDTFDALGVLDAWVSGAKPPETLIASRYENSQAVSWGAQAKPLSTRPICAWPKTAHYKGSGPASEASSFICR
ncbi:tannase/feruloyl esterase family alpha/beta hydrolase [Caulobacter sp. CCNWLY153]|uniref:Tannase/feruloyl esterase family alpha/beta hydrolase n=1 Tax=Caulobacter radicis TaxID=2172650 RepID=A0A2T9J7P1_9CAUL|nr:tannase/feruloyl esterase family alpha/beta hydrolase [Caulobacter radicis]PVM77568.1 tannase/feruloyl esterase family alpha/beta hydrolase [Caulobacter radicis]